MVHTERTLLSRQYLLDWAMESLAFHELDLSRMSTVFLAQAHACERDRTFSTFDLTDSLKTMEGLARSNGTPPEDQFKYPPLTGLYKKHFASSRFLPKNLLNFLRSKQGGKHFDLIWKEASDLNASDVIDEKFIGYLVDKMVGPPLQIKLASRAMTGEWVVFHKYEGKNYYLTLASHAESNEEIYERAALACSFDSWPFNL